MDDLYRTDLLDGLGQRGHGLATLEVRWIRRGPLPHALIERFIPSPQEIELREDFYLIAPLLRHLSLKIRGGVQLDIKVYRGTPNELNVPGVASGRMELWEKWAVPLGIGSSVPSEQGWLAVRKLRRKRSFVVTDGAVVERPMRTAGAPGCSVELTEVVIGSDIWWTLGLESGGPMRLLERELTETATFLLRPPLPDELRLDERDSMSYGEWLRAQSLGLFPDLAREG